MLRIAKVLKSNGTDGGLLVSAPEVELEEIKGPVLIEFDGLPAPFFIEDCTPRGTKRYIIHITDVCTLKDAEEMVGRDIFFDGEFEEQEEEQDLTGWKIYDEDTLVGVVKDYEPIPGNMCLYVERSNGEEVMIPLHEDFILEADPQKMTLTLQLPSGLY